MRLLLSLLLVVCCGAAPVGPAVQDMFGRDIIRRGLTVPDWEGYMANPAIEFTVAPPPGARLPVKITLTAREPRLYFDLPSTAGPNGPSKELTYSGGAPPSVFVAVFPARHKQEEQTVLGITMVDAAGRRGTLAIPLHVVPVESRDRSPIFPITIDFSHDQTGFYKDPVHRATFEQAINDWAYYLEDLHVKSVEAGEEKTWIFEPDGFAHSHLVGNATPYTGYLLYTYGIHSKELRSGGEPSAAGGFQVAGDAELPIRRSGGVEVETEGNYSTLGWLSPLQDAQWWKATNLQDVPNDLYSIVHHESGHALFFNPNNRSFQRGGVLKDEAVRAYLGSDPRTDEHDHFDGIVDPWSLHGAFGNEYHGKTPYGRWLITRLDLLCAQAVGYKLRKTAAFLPLAIRTEQLPPATRGRKYEAALEAEGGLPVYDWTISDGKLPPGLTLDRYTGQIAGTPRQAGTFKFTARVRDYQKEARPVDRELQITIAAH